MAEVQSSKQPRTPPSPPMIVKHSSNHVHQSLASAANLANLLPTGTVLAFHTLIPTFSNNGSCRLFNKHLTTCVITFCALPCFLSSFNDSFMDKDRKLYYGISAFKGMYIFNCSSGEDIDRDLKKYKIKFIDFVHAFLSLFVFLVFALSNSDVQSCFFPEVGISERTMNLPLGAGILSSSTLMEGRTLLGFYGGISTFFMVSEHVRREAKRLHVLHVTCCVVHVFGLKIRHVLSILMTLHQFISPNDKVCKKVQF